MGNLVLAAIAIVVTILLGVGATVKERVSVGKVGLLYRKGRFQRELPPGHYRWFDPFRQLEVHQVDMTRRVPAQYVLEVMSSDRFSFRMTVAPVITVTDARAYREAAPLETAQTWNAEGPFSQSHPVLADALLKAVGKRTLDEVLQNTAAVLDEAAEALPEALPGARLDRLLLTAVTVPPEVRKMFTEVERAKQAGMASLERARSEQASLRALANAARNLSDNPDLARLRLWQMIEQAAGQKTFVLGDVDRPVVEASK